MENFLLIDIGSTYTKVVAASADECRILGTAKSFTTVETDVSDGLSKALDELAKVTGIRDYSARYSCSSAAGGLKMISVGLVPDLTAEAAKMAALSAGAKVIKTYSYELNSREAEEIYAAKPDIMLLSGGTDGGNKDVILHNAQVISKIDGNFPVVVAGNKSVSDEVGRILKKGGKTVRICENVMPEFNVLNIEPAREMIRQIFLQRIVAAKGLTKVQELLEGIIMPTPSAVLKAASLLSRGTASEEGVGDLLLVDVGGATTDVYSIADGSPSSSGVVLRGLPEPFEKRTVEGDLGVRYSAGSLLEEAGAERVAADAGITPDELLEKVDMIIAKPELLDSECEGIARIDNALAQTAVRIAVERHAGRLKSTFTMLGEVFVQSGKELGRVKKIIGTGGSIINSEDPGRILKQALFDPARPEVLKPREAELLLDKKYILAAMGLLSIRFPEVAIRIMKKELEMI